MKTMESTLVAALILAVGGTKPVRADNILYFVDANHGTDQMAAALAGVSSSHTTVTASSAADFTTNLTSGGYSLAIFSLQNQVVAPDDFIALGDLQNFVASGGRAIVDVFEGSGLDISGFGANYTGDINGPAATMTAFNSGVTNPVSLSNTVPPWGAFSYGMTLDALNGVSVAGTFFDPGNSSGTNGQAAVIVGDGGRSIVNGFMNDAAGLEGKQIYTNEISTLLPPICSPLNGCPSVPEPSFWPVVAIGMAILVGYARFRRAVHTR